MSSSVSEYRVVLKPATVPLARASNVKLLDVTVDDDHPDPSAAALEQLHETGPIDSYALQSHWEVHHVYACAADPAEQLADALLAGSYTPQHWDGNPVPMDIRVNAQYSVWKTATLGVQQPTYNVFTAWKSDLADTHPDIAKLGDRYLHYAMLRVVADVIPDLADMVFTDPAAAHDIFLTTALSNQADVIDAHTTP